MDASTTIRFWTILTSLLIFCGFAFIAISPFVEAPQHGSASTSNIPTFRAPKPNVWADLTEGETYELLEYLHSGNCALNLTKGQDRHGPGSSILSTEILTPAKSAVLSFLDESLDRPARFARVIVDHNHDETYPEICEYQVGPLPITEQTNIAPLINGHDNGRHCTKNPFTNLDTLSTWFSHNVSAELGDVIMDLLGEALEYNDRGEWGNAMLTGRALRLSAEGRFLMWTSILTMSDAFSLLPQGLYLQVDVTPRDPGDWKLLQVFYNGKLYKSTDEFRAAWEQDDFEATEPNIDGGWTDTEDFGSAPEGRDLLPPVMVQPGGPRFKLDAQERFISWQGFEFYISAKAATGIVLNDIKFNGERIIYELGLQEAMAHYSGANPQQSGQLWLDSFFGMGLRMFELVPGYDCPAYATFLDTNFSRMETTWENPNSICIFESAADYALSRHTTDKYVSVSRNTYLVVRSVSTVGNYDYTVEYLFYLDGSIEVKVRASGYIFSAFYDAPAGEDQEVGGEDEYGYRVHDFVSGSMHDHVINFKADLDIAGTSNTLVRVDIEPIVKKYSWDAGFETPRNTMHLHTVPIATEAGMDWPHNSQAMYLVLNNDSRNAWGEKRGYRITPGTGMGTPPHLTIVKSTSLENAAVWSAHDLWVLRQKDSEPRSSHELAYLEPGNPLVDFSKFVNGEDTLQEDLVVYFNLGAHHIPHAGDIPNTLMTTSASSVMFVPHNFHDRDPSRATSQGVKIELSPKGNKAKYFGAHYKDDFRLKKTDFEPDLSAYVGIPHGIGSLDNGVHGMDTFMGMGIKLEGVNGREKQDIVIQTELEKEK